jgi:hypothetical protein
MCADSVWKTGTVLSGLTIGNSAAKDRRATMSMSPITA